MRDGQRCAVALLGLLLNAQVLAAAGAEAGSAAPRDPALDAACEPSLATTARGAPLREERSQQHIELRYAVFLDANGERLFRPANVAPGDVDAGRVEQQPQFGVATISGAVRGITLDVAAKRPAARPDLLWLDWFLINDSPTGLAGARVALDGLDPAFVVYDLTADLWAGSLATPEVALGGVAPFGVTRLTLGIGTRDGRSLGDAGPVGLRFAVVVTGTATRREATNSGLLAVSPDGTEVWAPVADGNVVAVVDTRRARTAATIAVAGAPRGMAITPDGRHALTVAPRCNQLVVLDRRRREVVQRFGEAEGIGREPRELVLSPDGSRVFVSSFVGDTIAAFERRKDGFAHVGTVSTGRRPTGLSVSPDGESLYVAHLLPRGPMADNEAWISVYASRDLALLTDRARVTDPGNPAVAGCLRRLSMFAGWEPAQLGMEAPFTLLHGVVLHPSGAEALVPSEVITPFLMFEGDMRKAGLDRQLGRITTSNILPFDTRAPAATRVRQLDTLFEIPDRDLAFQRCLDSNANIEFPQGYTYGDARPDILTSNGAMHPTGETGLLETGQIRSVTWTRGGRRAIFVSHSSDELAVNDGATRHPLSRRHLTLSGSNPMAVALTPDGATGYVLYENSLFLSVLDTSAFAIDGELPRPAYVPFWISKVTRPQASASLVSYGRTTRDVRGVPEYPPMRETGQIALLARDPLDARMRRGKVLFSSSNPDKHPYLTAHREGGCTICHYDGGNDGSMWVRTEGERRTMSLRGGVGNRGWLHAKATHHDAHELSMLVSREMLGGSGLAPADADALATYVAWGIPRLQAPRTDPALVARGRRLFARHCTDCHVDAFTELARRPDAPPYGGAAGEPTLYDVGTQTRYAGASMGEAHQALFRNVPVFGPLFTAVVGDRALGPDDQVFNLLAAAPRPVRSAEEFKAPSLVNTWDNALYFHDGRFHELRQAVKYMNRVNDLGLDTADIDALVEYLRTF